MGRVGAFVHLAAKDWRYVRAWAFAGWGMTAAAWAVLGLAGDPHLRHLAALVHLLALLVPFVGVVRLFQLDPVLDDTAFWPTRPIARQTLLASKVSVALLAIVAPCVLLTVAPLVLRGLGLGPRDYAVALAAMAARYALVAWFVLLIAAVTRTLRAAALAACGLAVALAAFGRFTSFAWTSTSRDEASFVLALAVLLPVQAAAYLHVLYRTRRLAAALATVAVTGAAVLALGHGWRWNFMKTVAPAAPSPAIGGRTDWPIRVELVESRGHTVREALTERQRWVEADIRIHGLAPGLALRQIGYDVTVEEASGERRQERGRLRSESERWMPEPTAALGCLGNSRHTVTLLRLANLHPPFATVPPGRLPSRVPSDFARMRRLSGRLTFSVARWSAPDRAVVDGGTLVFPGGRIVGRRPPVHEGAAVSFHEERLMPLPFPAPRDPGRPILLDPATADCLDLQDVSRAGGGSLTLPLSLHEESAGRWARRGRFREHVDGPIPAGTQMLFLRHEELGTLEVSFDVRGPAASAR